MKWQGNDLPSTHLNPINTPSCEQLRQIFHFSTLSRVPLLSLPPSPALPWAIDMCTSVGLSKPEKPLPTISSQSPSPCLGLFCPAFTSDTSFFRLWIALPCCAVQLEGKEQIPYNTESTYASTHTHAVSVLYHFFKFITVIDLRARVFYFL